jgi:hypothetical protein
VNDSAVDEMESTAGAGGVTLALPHPTATTQKIPANKKTAKRFMTQPSRIPIRMNDESANL